MRAYCGGSLSVRGNEFDGYAEMRMVSVSISRSEMVGLESGW